MANSLSFLARFLTSLVPVLVAVMVAKDKRGNCTLTLEVAKKQIKTGSSCRRSRENSLSWLVN